MKTIAFIPLRGGSKSIPLKNIKHIAGKPLAEWTISAALNCARIDQVIISTDSSQIKNSLAHLLSNKLTFYDRSRENAEDFSSTESAMLEYFTNNPCNTVVLIQATSPLLNSNQLDEALDSFSSSANMCNSMLSVVRSKRFFWKMGPNQIASPINYDFTNRPRRQDFKGSLVENGAFYITKYKELIKSNCRLTEPVMFYEMPENSFIELDEPEDWINVEKHLQQFKKDVLSDIRLFVTDVDGVLTDAGMYYSEDGNEFKKFNTRDGKGLELLRSKGIKTAIITSEHTKCVENRAKKLQIDFLVQDCKDKLLALKNICKEMDIDYDQVAYIGDDINDLHPIKEAGFTFCPVDAEEAIKNNVDFICKTKGGRGCVREAANLILNYIN